MVLCKALEGPESQMCASLYYQVSLVAQLLTRSGAGLADSTDSLVHFVLSTLLVTVVAQTLVLMVVLLCCCALQTVWGMHLLGKGATLWLVALAVSSLSSKLDVVPSA